MFYYRRNSDRNLRALERKFQISPSIELFRQLEAAHSRTGVPLIVPYQELLNPDIWDASQSEKFSFYDFINGPIVPQLCGSLLAACFDLLEEADPDWAGEILIWDRENCGEHPGWNPPEECFRELSRPETRKFKTILGKFIEKLLHFNFRNQNTSQAQSKIELKIIGDSLREFLRNTKHPRDETNWRYFRSALLDVLFDFNPHHSELEGREASIFEGNARFTLIIRSVHNLFDLHQKHLFPYLEHYLFNSIVSLKDDYYQWTLGLMLFTETEYGVRDTFPQEHERVMSILRVLQKDYPGTEVTVLDLNLYQIDFPKMTITEFQSLLSLLREIIDDSHIIRRTSQSQLLDTLRQLEDKRGKLAEWAYIWKPRVIAPDPSTSSSKYFC